MKILDRYILREIWYSFFASLLAMTCVLLLGLIMQLMDLMVNKGVSIFDIAKLVLFLMPYFLIFTIPISLLLSILIGLGRLSADNEITVLKGAGISIYRLLYPIFGASLAAFLLTLSLSLFFLPHSNFAMKNLLFSIIRHNASAGIREKVFNDNFKGLLLFANSIPAHGNFMEGVIISDSRESVEPSTIFAEKALFISDPESSRVSLRLENGSTHTIDLKKKSYRKMDFSSYDINLDMESPMTDTNRDNIKESTEMTTKELITKIKTPGLKEEIKRESIVELNKKFALPFSCLIFGILGLTLGIKVHKAARARGITIGILVMIIYYLFQLGGAALTEAGIISPWLGAWLPNLFFFTAGILLLFITAEETKLDLRTSDIINKFWRSR